MITTEDPDHPPIVLKDEKNWDIIHEAMHRTVNGLRGTAREVFKGAKYQAAGKTGTAQRVNVAEDTEYDAKKISKRNLPNAMFIGYAPHDNPQIVIAVAIENGEHGGSVAGPVARKIMDRYFEKQALNNAIDVASTKN